MKRCSMCRMVKPTDQFWARTRNWDGLQDWCKPCIRAYRSGRRDIEREHERRRRLETTTPHPEEGTTPSRPAVGSIKKWTACRLCERWRRYAARGLCWGCYLPNTTANREAAEALDHYWQCVEATTPCPERVAA